MLIPGVPSATTFAHWLPGVLLRTVTSEVPVLVASVASWSFSVGRTVRSFGTLATTSCGGGSAGRLSSVVSWRKIAGAVISAAVAVAVG